LGVGKVDVRRWKVIRMLRRKGKYSALITGVCRHRLISPTSEYLCRIVINEEEYK